MCAGSHLLRRVSLRVIFWNFLWKVLDVLLDDTSEPSGGSRAAHGSWGISAALRTLGRSGREPLPVWTRHGTATGGPREGHAAGQTLFHGLGRRLPLSALPPAGAADPLLPVFRVVVAFSSCICARGVGG